MAKAKKKAKKIVRKSSKSTAKKKSSGTTKRKVKTAVKKKPVSAAKKKIKTPARRKVARPSAKKKTKSTVAKKTPVRKTKTDTLLNAQLVPEVIKQEEQVQPIPVYNESHPQTIEQNKKFERKQHIREDVAMKAENQKVKAAMAKRQSMKQIFHTPR